MRICFPESGCEEGIIGQKLYEISSNGRERTKIYFQSKLRLARFSAFCDQAEHS